MMAKPVTDFQGYENFNAETFVDRITNPQGKIRLHLARGVFQEYGLELEEIVEAYQKWVNQNEYVKIDVFEGDRFMESICALGEKRGNRKYRWRLKKRLEWLNQLPKVQFFNPTQRDGVKKTKALFITLTYDTKLKSMKEAWGKGGISKEFNRWKARLRKWIGSFTTLRVYESFENGYPHIHLLLVAKHKEFDVVYRDKNRKWRIKREQKDKFRKGWHSNIDVFAVYEVGGALQNYLKKYLMKQVGDKDEGEVVKRLTISKAQKTLALLWLFRKRGWSATSDFKRQVHDLILRGVTKTRAGQFSLNADGSVGESTLTYVFVGIFSAQELGIKEGVWSCVLPAGVS